MTSPHVCFSLQSALEWALFLLRLGAVGPGLARGGHTRGPEGEQQIRGWGPMDRQHTVTAGGSGTSFVYARAAVVALLSTLWIGHLNVIWGLLGITERSHVQRTEFLEENDTPAIGSHN